MSGNTKLVGFLTGNAVLLERWGIGVEAKLSDESLEALRTYCTKLPQQAPRQEWMDKEAFEARFTPRSGAIYVEMQPSAAKNLILALETSDAIQVSSFGSDPSLPVELRQWADQLRKALQEREDYFDRDEPGIQ